MIKFQAHLVLEEGLEVINVVKKIETLSDSCLVLLSLDAFMDIGRGDKLLMRILWILDGEFTDLAIGPRLL